MSLQQSRTGRQYIIWYRHSGQPDMDGIPYAPDYETLTSEEITTAIGDHHITHMALKNELPPFDVISPHLTYLGVRALDDPSELHKLSSLTHLRELYLSEIDFHKGIPEVICQLTSLEYLDLDDCKLVDLPPQLSSLTHLRDFRVSADFHKGIPEAICQLTSLETLYLGDCKLVDLPPQLSSLTHLRELDLSINDFHKGIPEVICQLTSLETLVLEWCQLVDLPPHLSNLNQLSTLKLKENEFTDFPSVVYQLTSLQTLDLSSCRQLERIDDRILGLADLTKLACAGCHALKHPPYRVCKAGLSAVKNHFKSN